MIEVETVRSRLDYEALFRSHVKGMRPQNGDGEVTGLCPFHPDGSPSFSANLVTGLFKCFACGESGDAFDFYQKLKGVDFPTAVRELGAQAGLTGEPLRQQVVACFDYRDTNGKVLYSKERLEPGRD